jgi:hypothetical protein
VDLAALYIGKGAAQLIHRLRSVRLRTYGSRFARTCLGASQIATKPCRHYGRLLPYILPYLRVRCSSTRDQQPEDPRYDTKTSRRLLLTVAMGMPRSPCGAGRNTHEIERNQESGRPVLRGSPGCMSRCWTATACK